MDYKTIINGEMAEWFKAHAWKACIGETLSWVRIPFSPPSNLIKKAYYFKKFKNRIFSQISLHMY